MMKKEARPLAGFVLFACVAVAFGFQGSRGIGHPGEGVHVATALAMLESGDLTVPRLHHEPFLDHPPLLYWAVAASMAVFGPNEWGARLFHALCFCLTAGTVYLLGRSLARSVPEASVRGSRLHGLLAAFVYVTMVAPAWAANVVTPDTPLVLWWTLALYFFWESAKPDSRRVPLYQFLLSICLGLAVLTIGPAGLLPVVAFLVWLGTQGRLIPYTLSPWTPLWVVVIAALTVPWYHYLGRVHPDAVAWGLEEPLAGLAQPAAFRDLSLLQMLGRNGVSLLLAGTLPWLVLSTILAKYQEGGSSTRLVAWRHPGSRLFIIWILACLFGSLQFPATVEFPVLATFPLFAIAAAAPLVRRLQPGNGHEVAAGRLRQFTLAGGAWVAVLLLMKAGVLWVPMGEEVREQFAAMEDHLPESHYELLSFAEPLDGLAFYGVNLGKAPEESWAIEQLPTAPYPLLFLAEEGRAREVRAVLAKGGRKAAEHPAGNGCTLFVAEPAPAHTGTLRLAALGDTGTGNSGAHATANALALVYQDRPFTDGVLLLGDNIYLKEDYTSGWPKQAVTYFERPFAPVLHLGVPFYAALGNHDYTDGTMELQLNYAPFHYQGRRFYSQVFGEGLAEIFFLDTQPLAEMQQEDPEQIAWLAEALAASTAQWKIALTHHPLYSTSRILADERLIEPLEDLFVDHGVNLVLSGHNHLYERLEPVRGIHYVTAGAGGKLRLDKLFPDMPQRAAGLDTTNSFVILEIDAKTLHLTAYDSLRRVFDELVITDTQAVALHPAAPAHSHPTP